MGHQYVGFNTMKKRQGKLDVTSKGPLTIQKDYLVLDIMERWPETLGVFIDNCMLCVGCPIAPFHTVHDACQEHGLDESTILAQLDAAIAKN